MSNRFLGQVIFLRHGQTDYTDIFPDLTPTGEQTIKKTAALIKLIFNGDQESIIIFSSPRPRALGTAALIAKKLVVRQKIIETPILSAIAIKDKKKAKALFDEVYQGEPALSIAYGTDPRFEDGVIVEPRSEVKKRFFSFFSILAKWFMANINSPLCIIAVSHYEVLYHLVETIFNLDYEKDTPLEHGEIIIINVYDRGDRNTVMIKITFRNKKLKKIFDYRKKEIK